MLKSFVMPGLLAALIGCHAGMAIAQPKLPEPPYLVTGAQMVIMGVVWGEEAVRRALPAGMKPAKDFTGGINIYQAAGGHGVGPYQSAYFWVDLEGYDSVSGNKGRWMLQGVYGPDDTPSMALREFVGFPVRNGGSRFEREADIKRAIGSVNGQDFVTVKIRPSQDCGRQSAMLNYPTRKGLDEIPFEAVVCKAEPLSADVTATPGDPFAAFKPVKLLWAIEAKDAAFSITRPLPAGR